MHHYKNSTNMYKCVRHKYSIPKPHFTVEGIVYGKPLGTVKQMLARY